jgi:hypothetical protein
MMPRDRPALDQSFDETGQVMACRPDPRSHPVAPADAKHRAHLFMPSGSKAQPSPGSWRQHKAPPMRAGIGAALSFRQRLAKHRHFAASFVAVLERPTEVAVIAVLQGCDPKPFWRTASSTTVEAKASRDAVV